MKLDLKLDISIDRVDIFDGMEDTYRKEGLTVGSNYMRIFGVDFNVSYVFTHTYICMSVHPHE
jgi:hypothetical protein